MVHHTLGVRSEHNLVVAVMPIVEEEHKFPAFAATLAGLGSNETIVGCAPAKKAHL